MTQLEQANEVKFFRDQALKGHGLQALRTMYESKLKEYEETYNENPWIILAKEAVRQR